MPHQDAYEQVDQLYKNLTDSSYQIGGDHYSKLPIQPFDIIEQNNLNFFEGNILKYLLRYKHKNGVQDLEKAQHYLAKLIEITKKGSK